MEYFLLVASNKTRELSRDIMWGLCTLLNSWPVLAPGAFQTDPLYSLDWWLSLFIPWQQSFPKTALIISFSASSLEEFETLSPMYVLCCDPSWGDHLTVVKVCATLHFCCASSDQPVKDPSWGRMALCGTAGVTASAPLCWSQGTFCSAHAPNTPVTV